MGNIKARLEALERNPHFSMVGDLPTGILVRRTQNGGFVAKETFVTFSGELACHDVPLTDWRDYEPPPGYRESGRAVIYLIRRGASDGPFSDDSIPANLNDKFVGELSKNVESEYTVTAVCGTGRRDGDA